MARAKKDKNGYFYEVPELPPGPGGKRQRKFTRAKTAALLKEKIAKFHADQEQGIAPIRDAHEHTLASWLKVWLQGEQQLRKFGRRPIGAMRWTSATISSLTSAISN
jgi:hypothetical protein